MSTFAQLYYHLVFASKNREERIDKQWRACLHAYMAVTVKELGGYAQEVGGVADHVHLLVSVPTKMSVADFVRDLKRSATKWIQSEMKVSDFRWQEGYGAFSVSPSGVQEVRTYIKNQELHHRKMSFLEEYKILLDKVGIEYDERYLP